MSERTPLFTRTVLAVCIAHVSLILLCMFRTEEKPIATPTKRMIVKTVALQPINRVEGKQATTSPQSVSIKKSKVTPTKKENPKKNIKFEKAKKALAALSTEKSTSVLQDIKTVAVRSDQDYDIAAGSYENLLANILAQELSLPEPGDVKITLTIAKTGVVRQLQVIESKNQRNQDAVEKQIKQMHFPPLGKEAGMKNEKTFRILVK